MAGAKRVLSAVLILAAFGLGIWASTVIYDDVNGTFDGSNHTCVQASKERAKAWGKWLVYSISLQWLVAIAFALVVWRCTADCCWKLTSLSDNCRNACKWILGVLWAAFVVLLIVILNKLDSTRCKQFSAAVGTIGIAFPFLIILAICIPRKPADSNSDLEESLA